MSAGARVPYIAAIGFAALGGGMLFVFFTALLTVYGTRPARPRQLAIA